MTQQQQYAFSNVWGAGAEEVKQSAAREVAPGVWTVISVNL